MFNILLFILFKVFSVKTVKINRSIISNVSFENLIQGSEFIFNFERRVFDFIYSSPIK